MMLKEKLQKIIDASAGKVSDEARAIMSSATGAVADSIPGRNIPAVGDSFPEFILADSRGESHDSHTLLQKSQLILTFFRGDW